MSSSAGEWRCVEGGELERVACPACGVPEHHAVHRRIDGLNVVACEKCGLYYVNPQPTQAALSRFYADGYFDGSHDFYSGRSYFTARSSALRDEAITGWHFVRQHCDVRGKSVLDLGCASGELLTLARKHGATAVRGLELDREAAEYGRKAYGVDIIHGTIEDCLTDTAAFDIITAFDVLEHVKRTLLAFERIARALKPDGVLLCVTPNGQCIDRWGADWLGLQKDMEHLVYLRATDLQRMGQRFGLTLIHSHSEGIPLPIRQYSATSAGRGRTARRVSQPRVSIHNLAQRLRFRLSGNRVGHHLYAVLKRNAVEQHRNRSFSRSS